MLIYIVWILLSLLAGIGFMRMVLGPQPQPSTDFMVIFDWTYTAALFQIGSLIGGIVGFLFLLVEVFYFKKKLEYNFKGVILRFVFLLLLSFTVGYIYYLLEKVIDVI